MKTTVFGYPKIGRNRELKKILESFWAGDISKEELLADASKLNMSRVKKVIDSKIDIVPSNDFSLYDFVLDTATMLNIIPNRFRNIEDSLQQYFAMARGSKDAVACEMTKWFDTNYHYIVPELEGDIKPVKNRPLESFRNVKDNFWINSKPVIIGPFTFTYLSKVYKTANNFDIATLEKAYESQKFEGFLNIITDGYIHILKELEKEGCEYVQLDEPALVLDISDKHKELVIQTYKKITKSVSSLKIIVQTYYESLSNFKDIVYNLDVYGIGLDFVLGKENLEYIKTYGYPSDKILVAGLISGRDIWKTDFNKTLEIYTEIEKFIDPDRIILSNSSPLFHLPVTVKDEVGHLPAELIEVLSFADERLEEINLLKEIIEGRSQIPRINIEQFFDRHNNTYIRQQVENIKVQTIQRKDSFKDRYEKQNRLLNLPLFPTTTIGSFPQTKELRRIRADYKAGRVKEEDYKNFIKNQIDYAIKIQEEIGLDVFVHGEFERTDMVEFFGEKLVGFAFTKNGWVQSYGSRCVRPPIIFGDISRPKPMTVDEILYAQSLTEKPVKGMLTGPVTILNWSFYRKDIPKEDIAYQIALAIRDEVLDLERSGVKIIQIDEPAFREGLPLKKYKQQDYLNWAVKAFKLTHFDVKDETQIHTHMCYSEFDEIIEYIYLMDADVISIEASRSGGDILKAFENFNYDHGIGLGVYDIHSPRVPSKEEMKAIVERALQSIDKKLFWINPDCGLKTRKWEEVIPSLKNMVEVARELRKKYA